MNCESSRVTVTLTSGGSARRSESSLARTASTTCTVFWPDCRRTSMTSVRSPSKNAPVRASAVVSSTAATSRSRIGVPLAVVVTTMFANCSGRFEPAERAQRQLGVPLLDVAAGDLDVLGHDGVAHAVDGEAVRVQLLDVEDDLDLARLAAGDGDLADAVDRLDGAADLLVGDLRQRAERQRAREREADDRIRVRVDLGDDRRLDFRRQLLDRLRHLLAHVLRRVVDVALEHELERDARRCPRG